MVSAVDEFDLRPLGSSADDGFTFEGEAIAGSPGLVATLSCSLKGAEPSHFRLDPFSFRNSHAHPP